jgi:hypothetical protein
MVVARFERDLLELERDAGRLREKQRQAHMIRQRLAVQNGLYEKRPVLAQPERRRRAQP